LRMNLRRLAVRDRVADDSVVVCHAITCQAIVFRVGHRA
jgi:hypothetical protein